MRSDDRLPRPDEIDTVDRMIAELDATDGLPAGATRSYRFIIQEWVRFVAVVVALDAAARNPLDPGSADVLAACADSLIDGAAYGLAFALGHAGAAINFQRLSRG